MRLRMRDTWNRCMLGLTGVAVLGCMYSTAAERSESIAEKAKTAGWQVQTIKTGLFDLRAITNRNKPVNGVLTIYIEGDGHAWIDGQFPSDDPTPITPVALNLAMQQSTGAVAYLGRPCQYLGVQTNPVCTKSLWTNERFSETVVSATNTALDHLKDETSATKIQLVGYSGGAAVILLVAARRTDVTKLVTVAGNLDPVAWANQLKLEPLTGSLNPISAIPATQTIPQVDFVGGNDRVMPVNITEQFINRYPAKYRPMIINIPDNGHVCCWAEQWPALSAHVFQ